MSVFSAPSQTFIYDLINTLEKEANYTNTVLCYRKRELLNERPFESVVSRSDVEKRFLNPYQRLTALALKKKYFPLALGRFIDQQAFDVVHCHFAWVVWSCLLEALKYTSSAVPVVVSAHGSDVCHALQDSKKKEAVLSLLKRKSVVFTGATPFMHEQLRLLGVPASRLRVLPNSIKPGFNVKRKLNFFKNDGDVFKVVTNGRMVPWKGHEYLIKALHQFKQNTYAKVHLTIVGEGECRADLERLAMELDVYKNITFAGWVDHSLVPELLMEHDVYVQPSVVDEETFQTETFGVAVIEAVAVGLPVVVSRVGGLPFVVGDENKFAEIVEPGDSVKIAQALDRVFKMTERDNSVYANNIVTRFSSETQLDSCKSVYDEVSRV